MDGLLLVDKPAGPTSHEVVACVRRTLGERRIGHTGTLDPAATGLLPLVLGRATRLARFLSGHDKSYDAVVRFGVATDTYDGEGTSAGPVHSGPRPAREAVDRALDAFRGTFLQTPPAYSAKKIEGTRSYRLARRAKRERESVPPAHPASPALSALPALPAPVSVTARAIDIRDFDGDTVSLRVECSAGFYVRSLAHDLGAALGIGAHLTALRRTHSGCLSVDDAIRLDVILLDPEQARGRMIPLARMLSDLAAITLTSEGLAHAVHGRNLGPADTEQGVWRADAMFVRMLDSAGELVGIASPAEAPGFLHPSVVLK
jgi:tRNA pseudouridine55 synthase